MLEFNVNVIIIQQGCQMADCHLDTLEDTHTYIHLYINSWKCPQVSFKKNTQLCKLHIYLDLSRGTFDHFHA